MKQLPGSALVMILFITSISLIAVTASWYSASLLHDAACVRQRAWQQMQSAHGLLVYATEKAKKRFDQIFAEPQPVLLYQGEWPCCTAVSYTGSALSYRSDGGIKILVVLQDGSQTLVAVSAVLVRSTPDSPITVVHWGVREPLD
jgi:hypothetical protein